MRAQLAGRIYDHAPRQNAVPLGTRNQHVTQLAVVAFPELDQPREIEKVRERWDPMARVLPAHVTIVFPFSGLSPQAVAQHVRRQLVNRAAFDFELSAPTPADGGYVFLNVLRGAEPFVELNTLLYAETLAPYRSTRHTYAPHVTIGHLPDAHSAAEAARLAATAIPLGMRGSINTLALFILDGGVGRVEMTFPLASRRGA